MKYIFELPNSFQVKIKLKNLIANDVGLMRNYKYKYVMVKIKVKQFFFSEKSKTKSQRIIIIINSTIKL